MPEKTGRTGSHLKILTAVAFPAMLEQLGQIFLGAVDTYFAGQLSDNAIAAINASNMFSNLFTAVFASLSIGIMVMISHSLGEKKEEKANSLLRQAVMLGVFVGLAVGVVCYVFRRPFLIMAGAEGEILEMSLVYYQVVCVPCIFMCLTMVLSGGLKAMQNTKASMQAALIANVVNALLDWLFISLGLGVLGLGLATTLARVLNLALLLRLYIRGVPPLKLDFSGWKLDSSLIKPMLAYGTPILLTQLSNRFINLLSGSLVLHLGSMYYISHSVAVTLDEFVCAPMVGFEAAVAALVSNSLGAGKPKDAAKFGGLCFGAAAVFMTVLGAILAVFAVPLSAIFTPTPEIQVLVGQLLTFMAFFQWVSALAQVLVSAVQGLGDSRTPFLATLIGSVTLRLGGGYLLAYHFGWSIFGIWMGFVTDFALRCVILGWK
ncbi:MAG: MATE family efflux transporter, partial [Oscillospiraceae bacterium]|nr:MATE family efflux transporter [Oscillospiraceae bacterium]